MNIYIPDKYRVFNGKKVFSSHNLLLRSISELDIELIRIWRNRQTKILRQKQEEYFKKIFITHRYGIKNSKPSLYCFEKIKRLEQSNWDDLVYIGDNPNKDFISLNKVNAKTIRVLKGNYSDIIVTKKFEARKSITSLKQLNSSLKEIFK